MTPRDRNPRPLHGIRVVALVIAAFAVPFILVYLTALTR